MSIGTKIVALLSPLVGGRVFPDRAPFSTARPYITYQQVGGHVVSPLAKAVADVENGFIQVNVWCDLRTDADALANQVEAALITAEVFNAKPMAGQISTSDEELDRYGKQQDFSIWSAR
jgi:hypothetical protein